MANQQPNAPGGAPTNQMWGGRFTEAVTDEVAAFNASITFEQRLARYDIQGSRAQAQALEAAGVLSAAERLAIDDGLDAILAEIEAGQFPFSIRLEDIHMNVEARLTERIGDPGRKLHTGRSRNDQVATDVRLYLKAEIGRILALARATQRALVTCGRAHQDVIICGYTHLQKAQPVLFAHHMLAYVEMLERDAGRLADCRARLDASPLGSGALSGANIPIPRDVSGPAMGFAGLTQNSLDAVADRDFSLEFMAAAGICMMHLSRLAEELILWSTHEFGLIELPDRFCTGSSMMPQKKNPDMPELIRGKTGRVYGDLIALLTTMKGLPLAYNKDMQEDKEPLFDAVDTLAGCLSITAAMMAGAKVNRARAAAALSGGYLLATDLADYLASHGMPFREAHEVVGRIVRHCIDRGIEITDLTVADFQGFSATFQADIADYATIPASVARKSQPGGTAPARVAERLAFWEKTLP
ncbi:MAG: argininosuccinate lyase [Nitrospirae bacterium]|nr:argininosuccinate lyase [Nitrospirota bacterium]